MAYFDQIFAFERSGKQNTVVFMANMSKNYAQFTMNFNGTYTQFSDGKSKTLSDSYEYVMKPWEYWILIR